ncbi:3-deoxy-D-manno-octulosonic acid transferase [Pollutibacter soli]|uniref:3-deoxy-D-manno-octulosonic acid transferase n=1 Tax=Pollutibacter soli TaxID=3034157 RepID=UPI00301378BF
MTVIYNLGLSLYSVALGLASLWNPKAKLWVDGRKNLLSRIREKAGKQGQSIIWMHCASLGEFEQGRPVIEAIKKEYAGYKILITFFSPSGYEIRKNYQGADYIFYLPVDSRNNAREFMEIVRPQLAIFVKYEFWYHYLTELRARNVPTILLSGVFRQNHPFFKPWGGFWRSMLDCFQVIFVQDPNSAKLLQSIGLDQKTIVSGDTRFDRVLDLSKNAAKLPLIEKFCNNHKVVVAGSTWVEDDEVMDHFAKSNRDVRFVIAPHEILETRIKEVEKLYTNTIRFSAWKEDQENPENKNVLIIDNIGMLATLYQYADITFIGGAFGGDGIHNVLEAVVYYKPVVYGPNHEDFGEAVELVDIGAAETVENALELEKVFRTLLDDANLRKEKGRIAGNYVRAKAGATSIVMQYIQEKRLLTS